MVHGWLTSSIMSGAGKGHALGPVTPGLWSIVWEGPLLLMIYGSKGRGKCDI